MSLLSAYLFGLSFICSDYLIKDTEFRLKNLYRIDFSKPAVSWESEPSLSCTTAHWIPDSNLPKIPSWHETELFICFSVKQKQQQQQPNRTKTHLTVWWFRKRLEECTPHFQGQPALQCESRWSRAINQKLQTKSDPLPKVWVTMQRSTRSDLPGNRSCLHSITNLCRLHLLHSEHSKVLWPDLKTCSS